MSQALALLNLTPNTAPPGLVRVSEYPYDDIAVDERVAVHEAYNISDKIDYIFFRRFSDGRSSQVAAYVIDGTSTDFTNDELNLLHHQIWLCGLTPLLYVGLQDRVEVVHCASGPSWSKDGWIYKPTETIDIVSDISKRLQRTYSAYRLADGTIWEDKDVAKQIKRDKSSHKVLIEKVEQADKELNGTKNILARRLLLLTLLIKYLEDRSVFPRHWFANYKKGAKTFLDVIESADVTSVIRMLKTLKNKFNGDIFKLPNDGIDLNSEMLKSIARVVNASEYRGQLYFWDLYSFENIPVEVLSHIYQHFAEEDKGAIFTPPLLVNLLLDSVMSYDTLRGDEKILDPTCGSGVFLISAFRRMIHAWRARNDWQKPTPAILKEILAKQIYGIELQGEAAHITSFSLALGICDALRPDVIWRDLKFDELIDENLYIGEFESLSKRVKKEVTNGRGFDIIIGNPPFQSFLSREKSDELKLQGIEIPNRSIAYYVLWECTSNLLAPLGKICMIQSYNFLYNINSMQFRKKYFTEHEVKIVFDFISIRGMFKNSDVKIVAINATKEPQLHDHVIKHWTFRRTFATKSDFIYELDYYDHHEVPNSVAIEKSIIWKSNLLGGGRLQYLAQRLSDLPTIADFVKSNNLTASNGFELPKKPKDDKDGSDREENNSKRKKKKISAKWLSKLPFLPTKKFCSDTIDERTFGRVEEEVFVRTGMKKIYVAPMVLIKESANLYAAYLESGKLAFKKSIISITAEGGQAKNLKQFRNRFIRQRSVLSPVCHILGNRVLVSKATSVYKADIMKLPWPTESELFFTDWEMALIADIAEYMAEYIRIGQNSKLLKNNPTNQNIEHYKSTFLSLMKNTYPEMIPCGDGQSDGLRFQAFCFEEKSNVNWLYSDNWLQHLRSTIYHKVSEALRTVRIIRIYEGNTLILIKPNLLRYWIGSTAIRDVDGTVSDILRNGE